MMVIHVIPQYNSVPIVASGFAFYLQQDNWNDYNFYTTYLLYFSGINPDNPSETGGSEAELIGRVKILKRGQKKLDPLQLGIGTIQSLGENFCSLGQSLDYYERIAQLGRVLRDDLLLFLRDIVIFPEFRKGFEYEKGMDESLFRDIDRNDDIFEIAPILINGDFHKLPSIDLKFSFKIKDMQLPATFDFNSPKYSEYPDKYMPNRVSVLIGRNGSGKSTFLAKLSRIVFASTTDRKDKIVKQVGEISPIGLGFPRIINLSYSAFDSFQVPGLYLEEKRQIAVDMAKGVGRYVFCGIRDIVKELNENITNFQTNENGKLLDVEILQERQNVTYLKSIEHLCDEFVTVVDRIKASEYRYLFEEVLSYLHEESSLNKAEISALLDLSKKEASEFFMKLSTGHKFVLHSVSSIILYVRPRSLILFDEPETHLHPPLLAVLMKAIRHILSKMNAFMVVATHSPVVLQETLSKHIYIVRREGQITELHNPKIQTFGENIGLITSHVFGLSSDITDYHEELDKIITAVSSQYYNDPDKILSRIEKLFDNEMSMQARGYVLSKIYKSNQ